MEILPHHQDYRIVCNTPMPLTMNISKGGVLFRPSKNLSPDTSKYFGVSESWLIFRRRFYFWENLEIVINDMRKNQTFHFDLQIHPTLLNPNQCGLFGQFGQFQDL